jgi:hypothetical protein
MEVVATHKCKAKDTLAGKAWEIDCWRGRRYGLILNKLRAVEADLIKFIGNC